jgi:syntaxin-binding protein 5
MASYNFDGTIQFSDISAQLLSVRIQENLRPKALEHEFPNSLPALTIDINNVYEDPHTADLLGLGKEKVPRITLVDFSPRCACVIAVESGDVMVFRMRASTIVNPCHCKELPDPELIPAGHIQVNPGKQLEPHLIVHHISGRVEASSIASIGKHWINDDYSEPHIGFMSQDFWQFRTQLEHSLWLI